VLFPATGTGDEASVVAPDQDQSTTAPKQPWPGRLYQFTSQHLKVVAALVLGMVIFATWMVMRARTVPLDEPTDATSPIWTMPADSPTPTVEPQWLVHVVGAVANPGVIRVAVGARVIDVIETAGGLTADADPGDLNLAAVVADGCQVVIGTQSEPRGEVRLGVDGDPSGSSGTTGSGQGSLINLNQATAEQLDTLPGVGPVTAAAIVTWRDTSGPFTVVEQLQEVDGIGPKTFAQIQPYVCL
jgi:competence protein ComEA